MEQIAKPRGSAAKLLKSIAYRYPAVAVAVACISVPILVGATFGRSLEDFYQRPYYVGITTTLAILVVSLIFMHRDTLVPSMLATWRQIRLIDPNWLFVLIAIALRHVFLEFLPPDFAAFEEINQGKFAYAIVNLGEPLTFHMWFTNALGAISFALVGQDLDSLRTAFEFANSLAILLVAISLRRLNVGWTGTLVAVFIMATTRWAVVAAGFAEESFGPTLLVALLVMSLIYSDTSRRNSRFWAAIAGIVSALLFYEYVPYTFLVPLPAAFWLFRALFAKRHGERIQIVQMSLWYIAAFALTSAPLLSQFIFDIRATHLGDRFFAHDVAERSQGVLWSEYAQQWFGDTMSYISVILGTENQRGSTLFRASGESMIPLIVGIIFGLGLLDAIRRPQSMLIFIFAITVLGFSTLIAIPSDRFFLGRLTPMLPILIITSGVMLDRLANYLTEHSWKRLPRVGVLATILVGVILWVNFVGIVRMSEDESTLNEYVNNNYVVCKPIGEQPFVFEKVITVADAQCSFNDEIWLYRETTFEAENMPDIPTAEEIRPGTLIVVGNTRGLSENMKARISDLARATGSSDTLLEFKTMLDRTGAVTFCHQCGTRFDQ